ncbi:MAG TPA: bestrophin family ion channel [Acidisoma sp.]|uniref:bestrophin family protein n=1 Tax=Acidisoma sp. TaxID=1872115 RepID=UPI002BAFE6BF|nr:bestrophin family ion channel [Acidisoma sp.]HTI00490.1 bestrophin family ion channel [Acidisoma sp.]
MIVRPHPSALSLFFILRGSILRAIVGELLAVCAIAFLVVLLHGWLPWLFSGLTLPSFTVLGLALSIFLGFRNNVCYQRWWEARRQWGQLIAETRAFLRDVRALLPDDDGASRRMGYRAIAFAHALRCQLRKEEIRSVEAWLPPEEWEAVAALRGKPDRILHFQAREIAAHLRGGLISDILYRNFSDRLNAMSGIQAACERLHTTPTPFAYTLLLHRTAWLFCLLLPFGLVSTLGLATPVVTVILAYAFFGLDALGQELQEPFEATDNAVPLDALVRTIEIATLEVVGGRPVPEPLKPRDYVLL